MCKGHHGAFLHSTRSRPTAYWSNKIHLRVWPRIFFGINRMGLLEQVGQTSVDDGCMACVHISRNADSLFLSDPLCNFSPQDNTLDSFDRTTGTCNSSDPTLRCHLTCSRGCRAFYPENAFPELTTVLNSLFNPPVNPRSPFPVRLRLPARLTLRWARGIRGRAHPDDQWQYRLHFPASSSRCCSIRRRRAAG